MIFQQAALFTVLLFTLIGFIWEKWRYDVVASLSLFTCVLLGVVPVNQAFSGFAHSATITVALVLLVSYGLTTSGALESITKFLDPISKFPLVHITALIFIAAVFSMFMNNVGALALLLPIAIRSTQNAKRAPASVLMPLSFGSILGGLVTLIGTPPNIIISAYRQKMLGQPFDMFDFTPVGASVALVGIAFIVLIGWRLVVVRKSSAGIELFEIESYLFKVKVMPTAKFIEKTYLELEDILKAHNINLVSLIHKKQNFTIIPRKHVFVQNDILFLEGSQEEIDKFVSTQKLSLLGSDNAQAEILHSAKTKVLELIVAPGSVIENKTVEQIRFKRSISVNLLAVSRQGKSHRGRMRELKFKVGDILLIHGEKDTVEEAATKLGCFPLAERALDFNKRKLGIAAFLLFFGAIMFTTTGLLPIQIALGICALFMILLNIIPLEKLYQKIDWPVIVLLGTMIPIGTAIEKTGSAQLLTDYLLYFSAGFSVTFLLTLVLILTMTLSDILNNAATALLMAPISYNIALSLNVNPDPFLMAVAIGASCAFLTPIGHQNNAFILGPGGYQFGDYWRMGLPLEILIVLVAIPLIVAVWPV